MSTPRSLPAAFQRTVQAHPDRPALRDPGTSGGLTWAQYGRQVCVLAGGLAAAGVRRGDAVALMLTNRIEFHLLDTAVQHLGATPFSLYNTSTAAQLASVFANARPVLAVGEAQFLEVLCAAATGSTVREIVTLDGPAAGLRTLADVAASAQPDFDFESSWRAVEPGDVLTIIYTSGTTGDPKGVEITHANMLAQLGAAASVQDPQPGDRVISFLPAAHIAERRGSLYLHAYVGTEVTCVADRAQLLPAMIDVRPTLFGAVPAVWQKIRLRIEAGIAAAPGPVREQFARALEVGRQYVLAREAGELTPEVTTAFRRADEQVLRGVRARIGLDKARSVLSGAAAMPRELTVFFNALGLPLTDAWGMSELSGYATLTPTGALGIGTVGKPLPCVEIVTAADGELLARGPILMKGYRGRPDLTSEVVDADGWLHTGDLGEIDADGFVRLLDRKKEMIINSYGKNLSPATIEQVVRVATPLVAQVVAVGDGRPCVVALLVLDEEAAAAFAAANSLAPDAASLFDDPGLRSVLAAAVERANGSLSRPEQVKNFAVVPEFWSPGSEVLTHTMKVRRRPVAERYAGLIDSLYRDDAAQQPDPAGAR